MIFSFDQEKAAGQILFLQNAGIIKSVETIVFGTLFFCH